MSISDELEIGIIGASAIGLMMALSALGLNKLINKSPMIAAIGFIVLIIFARRISDKVG